MSDLRADLITALGGAIHADADGLAILADDLLPFVNRVRATAIADTSRTYQQSMPAAIKSIKADAWDEGYLAGDPYHRRGNPTRADNPYRDPVTSDQAFDELRTKLNEEGTAP